MYGHSSKSISTTSMDIAENLKRKNEDVGKNPKATKVYLASIDPLSTLSMSQASHSQTDVYSDAQVLKFTFNEPNLDFTTVSWSIIKEEFVKVSGSWDFISFTSDSKSVFFKEADKDNIDKFTSIDHINFEEKEFSISIVLAQQHNVNKGIIRHKFLIGYNEDKLKASLTSQEVTNFIQIQKIDQQGYASFTGSVILFFKCAPIPENVTIDLVKLRVTRLRPRPMQCKHCMLLGHLEKNCSKLNVTFCTNCFHKHDEREYCKRVCKNCSGSHNSNDKKCKTYIKEVEILDYKERTKISYFDAKSLYESRNIQSPEELNDADNDKSRKEEISKLREDFQRMSVELRATRENEIRLTVENAELKEIMPTLTGQISSLRAKIATIKTEHHEEIKDLFSENKNTLNELSQQNTEYATQIENAKTRTNEMEKKYFETKKELDETKLRMEEFVTSNQTIKKAFQTFYTKMSKAGNPAYPSHHRPTSE